MIVDLIVGLALDSGERPETPKVVENRWHDSGNIRVWRGVPRHARDIWLCIRRHESIEAGHWRASNPYSSASGAGQWLDSTWRGVARWVKVDGVYVARSYSRAKHAPAWVQDAAFVHVWRHNGLSMWAGTHCAPSLGAY
jgi:hypothetical protein